MIGDMRYSPNHRLIISDKSIISLCDICVLLCGEPISPTGNLFGVIRSYYSSIFTHNLVLR